MTKRLGFIGYGFRSETMMKAFAGIEADLEVAAICDPRAEEIRRQVEGTPMFPAVHYYKESGEMLDREELDGVFVGTRCPLHTPKALEVFARDLPLFLEKPVAITPEQLRLLEEAAPDHSHRTVVSFPLRLCTITLEVRKIIQRGDIGQVTMVQAVNNVPYGGVYYHNWYRDESLTGGLFLQKTTHDIDYISFLIGEVPTQVYAQEAKLYYKGLRPAGLRCPDCPEYRTCPESSYTVGRVFKDEVQGELCCFARDTGNHDAASAIFTCASGVIISYSQNFIAKKGARRRGCRVIGTEGSVEFDFYTGQIRFDDYRAPRTVTHVFEAAGTNHFGGDERLALAFLDVLEGRPSAVSLRSGLDSAACCLAARQSAAEHRPVSIFP